MLAIAYRGQDIIVWDLEDECVHEIYGQDVEPFGAWECKRQRAGEERTVLFSADPEQGLLAVGYGTGELVVFNTLMHTIQARASQVNALTMAVSPDGAMTNSVGMILIFEIETLRLLYRIILGEHAVRG